MEATITDDLVEQRILEAYAGAGPTAVVTAWGSLRLQGGGHFDGLKTRWQNPTSGTDRR